MKFSELAAQLKGTGSTAAGAEQVQAISEIEEKYLLNVSGAFDGAESTDIRKDDTIFVQWNMSF